jgi:multiple sugar transport system permease protein
MRTRQKNETKWAVVLVMPALIVLTAVILIPELIATGMAFTQYRLGVPPRFVGLANFRTLMSDPGFLKAILTNLIFVVVCVFLQMVIGIGLSLHLAKQFRFQRFWIALIMAPAAFTPSVLVALWKYLLHFQIGPINFWIESLGIERIDFLSQSNALWTVILIAVYQSIPFVFMLIYPARTTISESLYESASCDGASQLQSLRFITLPLLKPAVSLALVFRIIFSLREFGVPWLLTRGGPQGATRLLALYLYQEGFAFNRLGRAAAVSLIMLLLTVVVASYHVYRMYRNTFVDSTAY